MNCNKCGESMVPKDADQAGVQDAYGLVEASVTGGYFSHPQIGDLIEHTFNLCEPCLVALFATFKIPPKRFDLMVGLEATP